jgi:hypothetical protein
MRSRSRILAFADLAATSGCITSPDSPPQPPGKIDMQQNRLAAEKSPYLLQHKDNPVWWQPWGEDALAEAKRRDVPVFLSVGYSTCHWCHVMEHESFEDEQVAKLLNDGFVSIKVDREERPDVDALYMDAVQAMTGRGGWPMSVWMTPDGRPFATGTYFPKPHFMQILENISRAWKAEREKVVDQAQAIVAALEAASRQKRAGGMDHEVLAGFVEGWRRTFDPQQGGRQGAPKFPPAYDLQLLLRLDRRGADEITREVVSTTLDRIAASGTYDHLGGGFHRYATDEEWLVPHFEKMLYDQASLAIAYVEAHRALGVDEYALVARETLDYVLRDLTHPDGGFYSAEDADSEGEEGKFYVWTPGEIDELLGEDEARAVTEAFGVTERGNFEHGTTILALQDGHARVGRSETLGRAMTELFAAREQRIRPHLDDKILTDWNGLMITAMARTGRLLGEPRFVDSAERAARFVLEKMRDDEGRLWHRWREGQPAIRGFLDDYAFMTEALIELHQATLDERWLDEAIALMRIQDGLFWDTEREDYFATDGTDETLLIRRVEPFDSVVPAGRSVAALNALRLGDLLADEGLAGRGAQVLASSPQVVHQHPVAFAKLLAAVDYALDRSKEIALVVPSSEQGLGEMRDALGATFLPNAVVMAGPGATQDDEPAPALLRGRDAMNGRTTAYVCESGVCQAPTDDPDRAVELAASFAPFGGGS